MRILHISKKIPFPQKDGESIANTNLAQSLHSAGINIDLLSLNTNKHYSDHKLVKDNLAFYSEVHIVDHELKLKPTDALQFLLTDRSYNIERFKSVPFRRKLEDVLSQNIYDCILLETIYVLPYVEIIKRLSSAVIIIRTHNVEHHIWKNRAEQESNLAKSYYLDQLAKQLEVYQKIHIPICDGVISVSQVDYEWYKEIVPESKLLLSPIGIDYDHYQSYTKTDSDFRFGFIGAMDWQPNVNGINWYLKNVWPIITTRHQSLRFHLAGRHLDLSFDLTGVTKIINYGEVDDSLSFLSSLDVLVVPLFIASGIRVKIIEAMAMGKAVITTEKGLQGISAIDGKEVLIANTAQDFIELHDRILEDGSLLGKISSHASRFALDNFDQQKLTNDIIGFINYRIDHKYNLS